MTFAVAKTTFADKQCDSIPQQTNDMKKLLAALIAIGVLHASATPTKPSNILSITVNRGDTSITVEQEGASKTYKESDITGPVAVPVSGDAAVAVTVKAPPDQKSVLYLRGGDTLTVSGKSITHTTGGIFNKTIIIKGNGWEGGGASYLPWWRSPSWSKASKDEVLINLQK